MAGRRFDSDLNRIASGDCGRPAKHRGLELRRLARKLSGSAPRRTLDQHGKVMADQGAITLQRNLLLKRDDLGEPAALFGFAHGITQAMGARVLAHRIFEGESGVEANRAQELERSREIALLLA